MKEDGYERWFNYNENGNLLHYKDSRGSEKYCEYDENGTYIIIV